jgi:hypothetical protein
MIIHYQITTIIIIIIIKKQTETDITQIDIIPLSSQWSLSSTVSDSLYQYATSPPSSIIIINIFQ